MEKIEKQIESYALGKGFIIDIENFVSKDGEFVEAWISHERYGAKDFIISEFVSSHETLDEVKDFVMEVVSNNIESYIRNYKSRFMVDNHEE